jgi:hypothetical protein
MALCRERVRLPSLYWIAAVTARLWREIVYWYLVVSACHLLFPGLEHSGWPLLS